MRSHEENLRQYARLAVREGVAVAPGQELILSAETDQTTLVRMIVEEAYKAGASHVEVLWRDPGVARAKYLFGDDSALTHVPQWLVDGNARAHREGAARLSVVSSDPKLLSDIAPDRVAAASKAASAASREVSQIISAMQINWCVIGAASAGWAAMVFPDLPESESVQKLWDKILLASRALEPDPVAAWTAHMDALEARVAFLNGLRLDALRFRGPGTDLEVGLVEGHIWAGGRGTAKNGIRCSPNVPTEEAFTMPHRMRTNGVVCSSMPLSLRGQVVDGIQVEFKDGLAVSATAKAGEEALTGLLASDEGAKRLGEVALVPNSCLVAQTGTLFYNTLFDENAASHIAFGACYGENLAGSESLSEEQKLEAGANDSIIHVDWMIGSGEMDVDGLTLAGETVPLMRSGEWV